VSEDKLVGKKFDRYQINTMLGRGLLATTYQALDASAHRVVAVKIFRRSFMEDKDFYSRFEREVRSLARLEHSNIVPILDFGKADGQAYLTLPYIAGGSLGALIGSYGSLSPGEASSIIEQVAAALGFAHERGVLHRNLVASNILVDESGAAFVTDFSLPVVREAAAVLMDASVEGPPSTMPPEIASGDGVPSPASDIYSLGVVMYQTLTGQLPYPTADPLQQIMAHVSSPVPSPRSIKPGLDEGVAAVIQQAMAKDPADRFESMSALSIAFMKALGPTRDQTQRLRPLAAAGISTPPPTPPTLPDIDLPEAVGHTTRQLDLPPTPVDTGELLRQRIDARRPSPPAPRRRTPRRRVQIPARWYSVLLTALLLLVVWFAVGVLGGSEVRRQANRAQLDIIHQTQTPAAGTADARQTATLGVYLADLGTETRSAQEAAATATAYLTPTATRTPKPTATPTITPTPFAGSPHWIAFVAEKDGDPDIFLIDPATGDQVRVTDTERPDDWPAWSPDGRMLAFQAETAEGQHIFVLDIACVEQHADCVGDAEQLTFGPRRDSYPVWGPGGQQIVFISQDATGRTWLRSVNLGGEERDVSQIVADNRLIEWTADDDLIFFGPGEGTFEVFRLPIDLPPQDRVAITRGQGSIEFADLSADGSEAVYSRVVGNRRQLFLADATCPIINDCVTVRLTDDPFSYLTPRLSPDGTLIVTVSRREGNLDLYLIDRTGEDLTRLTSEPYDEYNPVWQPGG